MHYLYAVQMLIPGYDYAPLKIGISVNPEQRASDFTRAPFPTVWLGRWPAPNGYADELAAHDRFRDFRLCGEWFYPAPVVVRFVEGNLDMTLGSAAAGKLRKKDKKFAERLAQMFDRKPTPAIIPDPFDWPDSFRLPYQDRIEIYMAAIAERWPQVCGGPCYLRAVDVAELTGLPLQVVKDEMRYVGGGRYQRYKPNHVRAFLEGHPSYLPEATQ